LVVDASECNCNDARGSEKWVPAGQLYALSPGCRVDSEMLTVLHRECEQDWVMVIDKKSGKTYYWNQKNNDVQVQICE